VVHKGWVRIGGNCFQNKSRYPKIPVKKDNKVFPFDLTELAKQGKVALPTAIGNI
jgi:hypothetical protein